MSGKSPVQQPGDNVREDGHSSSNSWMKKNTFCAFKLKVSNILTGEHVSKRLRSRVRTLFFIFCLVKNYTSHQLLWMHIRSRFWTFTSAGNLHCLICCGWLQLLFLMWTLSSFLKTGCQFTSTYPTIYNTTESITVNICLFRATICLLTALWNCMFIQGPAVLVMTTVRVVARIRTHVSNHDMQRRLDKSLRSFRFHNIKKELLLLPASLSKFSASPQALMRTEECAKSRWGKAKSSPCATPLLQVYFCQEQIHKEPCSAVWQKGNKHELLSLAKEKKKAFNFPRTIHLNSLYRKRQE